MFRRLLRPLLVILTLGALLVALVQVSGRIVFSFIDEMEPAVNRLLASRGVSVEGLSGSWRMLNPVIHAERIEFPAGHLSDVLLEVGMVESVLRGTPLARRFKVADGEIAAEKAPGEPWRLRGAAEANDFDLRPVLEHSDQLEIAGRIILQRHGVDPARVRFRYLGLNRGGEHRHALELENAAHDCRQPCVLRVDYHGRDALWPLRPGHSRLTAGSAGFLLPRAVLGISPMEIAELELGWQRQGPDSGGALRLRTEQLDMPGDVTLAVDLAGTVRGRDGIHAGSVTEWRVEEGEEVWHLPEVAVRADGAAVSLWMPQLDLARAAGFVQQALGAVEPAQRWIDALNLRGTARNVRLAYGFDGAGLSYAMTLNQVAMDGYKGVPTVANASGELFGYERGVQVNVNAQAMEMALPDVFTDRWTLPYAQGVLRAWFQPGYFGVRGLNLRAEAAGTRAAGGFAMTRPPDREGQRLLLLVSTEAIAVDQAQRFVPYKLPEQLRSWLETAPGGGVLEQARLAYQGQFQEEPGELARRIELVARVRDGALRYHPDWPEVTGLHGRLAVQGPVVEMDVEQARSAGARLGGSHVRVVDRAAAVNVSLDADTQADAVLAFLRDTPLSTWLGFVEPDWEADGPMRLSGELHVPLNNAEAEAGPAVRLRGDMKGVALRMPGYRVALQALEGSFRYRYPYQVDASGVTGRMFDAPVRLSAGTSNDRVHLRFRGRGGVDDVWRVAGMEDPGLASGAFEFDADLGVGVANDARTVLAVSTDLAGAELRLPAGYGKTADEVVPAGVRVEFRQEYQTLQFDYRDVAGWLHFDGSPLRGAVGFAATPLGEEAVGDSLVLGGRIARFQLEEVLPRGDGGTLPLPIRLNELKVGRIDIGGFAVTRAAVGGVIDNDFLNLQVDSAEVVGLLERSGDAPLIASLPRVTVPATDGEGDDDPLTPDVIAGLPAADVDIGQLNLGDEDYGSWRFLLRPQGRDLEVRELEARVRGVGIRAADGLVWHGDTNQTRFRGVLEAGNLAEVLPQWGYAPSVETDSATLEGAFSWPGSPLMVDLLALRGEAVANAEGGRFLDVESGAGALKIFSLMNFTAIAKRVSLNFSDVFGRGVSFDELHAEFTLDEGLLEFLGPMEVEGTGSAFRVTGTVNLAKGELDNEMVLTLPVSKSLPWYAAYVALANPLAGLGVLVGERVLRKPLEQFSSARYRIGGTLEDPDVKFVSVFDVTPAEGAAPEAQPTPDADAEAREAKADSNPDSDSGAGNAQEST